MAARFLTPEQARRFYDRIGRGQDARPLSERRALDALAAQGDFGRAAAVLEFGCGTGGSPPGCCASDSRTTPPTSGSTSARTWSSSRERPLAPWAGRARVELTDGASAARPGRVRGPRREHLRARPAQPGRRDAFVAEARRVLRPGGLLALASLSSGPHGRRRASSPASGRRVWSLNPALLGGCRPLRLGGLLDPDEWVVLASFPVTDWFLSSDVLVARLR